jgi:hypothetical protein
MSADDYRKYFDPATNDFILQPEEAAPDLHPERADMNPKARRILEVIDLAVSLEHPAPAPFMTADEMKEAADIDASALAADIARLYPGRNEIELDGITVVRMMSGGFQVNSFPLAELSTRYLSRLRAAVRGR